MNRTQQETGEANRLRRELIHSRQQNNDLIEEMEEKHRLYINAERDQLKTQWNNTKESIGRVENIVQSKVDVAMAHERAELSRFREENQLLKQRLEIMDQEKDQMNEEKKQLMDKVLGLTQDLAFYARNAEARDGMKRLEALREEKDIKERKIVELLNEINTFNNQIEDLKAENSILRKMANVPTNYGVDIEQIKLHEKEKIEDYKKLIRVLQDDNYRLEEERARLKHMLKQQSMMYKQEPSQRYKGLTQEQIFKVDSYVMRLLNGETEDPADFYKLKKENKQLKDQLDILNKKGFDLVKGQIEHFFKDNGFNDSKKILDQIVNSNSELAKLIMQLFQGGVNTNGQSTKDMGNSNWGNQASKFRPPIPHPEYDGNVNSGFSYKYETHLDVVDRNGKPGISDATKYDAACLQLYLQESLEIIKRKDENLTQQQNEIDGLYRRVRDYLLIQDQLYKDFVSQEKEHISKKTELEITLRNTRDSLNEEQMKVRKLEGLIQTLQKGDKQNIENRLIELTKLNSILDINLLRLTRKYQTLEEQEQMLRREYHNKEADMAEKDRFVQDRINKLKEWKARAIQQLKFLFQKLRLAVPLSEYQSIESEMDLTKQRNADFIDRNSRMAQKLSKLQSQLRANMEFEERYRNLQELKDEAENELDIVKKRLEQVDINYKWENAIFNKIVFTLKRVKISPQQAFEEFDENKDGKLKREEFVRALDLLKINDISNQEIDILMNSLDMSGDGYISYKEFVHKLSRHGIRSRTTEEQIIFLIIEALKKAKVKNLSEAFTLIDKEQRGFIQKDDFRDIFKNLGVKAVDSNDLDKFIDQFWKDKSAGIDYQQFLRIFKRYQIKLEEEENAKQGKFVRVPEEIIKLKKTIYMAMNKAFQSSGKTLKGFFSKVDADQSDKIDLIEFKSMFERMKIQLSHVQAEQLFNSVDFDQSGDVTFPEFISDFEHVVQTDLDTLCREEKEKAAEQTRSDSRGPQQQKTMQGNDDIIKGLGPQSKQNADLQYQTRIAILEAREKQMERKLEVSMRILKHTENAKNELSDTYNQLERKWNEMSEEYHVQKGEIVELKEELRHSIKKNESERIKLLNEKLQTELVETKAAMISYKNMTEVISDQTKGLKLMIERKKDENENLVTAVRELQSQSVDQQRLGKLYYVVMLSRWQEAAVNKKYDMILTENKELRKELINQEQLHTNKDDRLHECENLLQDKQLNIEKLKQSVSASKNLFLTLDKAQEFNSIIQEISDDKSELEESYFKLRAEFLVTQIKMEEETTKADHANELLHILEYKKQSELSDKVIEMSEKLQKIRLSELRATREHGEFKEKNNYLGRLLKTQVDSIKKLEQQVSEFESKMHKREEEFRRADNERMRRFFNAKYDNIQGAVEDNIGSRQPMFQQSPGFKRDSHRDLSQPPSYIESLDRQRSGAGSSDIDSKMLEGQIKRLKEELKNAVDQIKGKDSIINRFKEWQLADKYLSQDSNLKEAIDQHRFKNQEIHEQESKEMAEAAYVTIKTLQEMLDQKNEQLRNKEELISKMTKQMSIQREQDQTEVAKLHQQLSMAGDTTLSRLQEIVTKHEAHKGVGGPSYTMKYERMTREELQRLVQEKDQTIQEISSNMSGLKAQLEEVFNQKKHLQIQNAQLEQRLYQEQQNNQVKANQKELDDFKRKLNTEKKENEKLIRTIQDLNMGMLKITKENVEISEDQKMLKIQENTKAGDLIKQMQDMQNKIKIQDINGKKVKEELKQMKIKEQEKEDKEKKLAQERDDAQKALKQTRETLENEIKKRQALQIEVNNNRSNNKIDISNGPSLEQVINKNKELENDVLILQCQQKTVVVYNKESATFEYVGEPILLNFERELLDLDEILDAMKKWLQKNERLTIKSIFESIDKENFGELTEQKFELALSKIGVKLRAKEKQILKAALDPKDFGYYKYRPLIRELSGIPQLEFIPVEIQKLAKLVEFRDLDNQILYKLIDPLRAESMNLQQFQDTMTMLKSENFEMKAPEIESIFKYITKSVRTVGVTLSISKLCERVFVALSALIIERMRDALFKSMKSIAELFQKYDSNKDGFLDYAETENLFLECQLAFKPNVIKQVYNILDPGKRQQKVSYQTLKFYISDNSSQLLGGVSRSLDMEPSQDHLSEQTSIEELNLCRIAARKILSACQNNLPELLAKRDIYNEGIVGREDVQKLLEEQKIPELTLGELNLIMKFTDKGHKGYISIQNFIDKLQELAIETKQDTMLRRFGTTIKHQGINIKVEMSKYEQNGKINKMDKNQFKRAMKGLSIALTDEEIDLLFLTSEIPESKGNMDIRVFVSKVIAAQKSKPLPTFIAQAPKTLNVQSKLGKTTTPSSQGTFENWELEKKYKKKLEALQQQIEESKKETQAAEKQAKHWQEMSNKVEKEKNSLQTRLVDLNAKPPKAAQYESLNQGQIEQMQGLKDQLFYLQEGNNKLEKTIQVELKAEIGRLARDKDKLEEKVKHFQEENKRLDYQIKRLIGKPMDQLEQREEGELWRERRILELEKELEQRDLNEQEVSDSLFRAEEKVLDLKFQKETFDLQYARLQKRITDLEQYKLASSKFSAVVQRQEDEEMKRIEEVAGNSNGFGMGSRKQQDSVKLRSKSSKSVAELEMVIESLKRVIEKQKTQIESMQNQLDMVDKHKEKMHSEKQMRQKINNLQEEVHSHEMKEINGEEKDKNIKKMMQSNKSLRDDLKREEERYQLLEKRYKDLLIKYNVLSKDHASNVEKLFALTTGGNIHNYEDYLSRDASSNENPWLEKKNKVRDQSGSKKKNNNNSTSFDRQFEDAY